MKKRKKIVFNNEVITERSKYIERLKQSYFLEKTQKIEESWTKCIELKEKN